MEHGSDHKGLNHYGRLAIELTLDFTIGAVLGALKAGS